MIAQEAPSDFDNEFVSFDCGRGIMQTTTNEYVGCGSGIECYSNGAGCLQYTHVKDKELTIFDENNNCKCMHYTNTTQGIEANIRDGLYALSDKNDCQCCYDRGKNAEWDAEEGLYREEMGGEVIFYSRGEECKGGDGQTYDSKIEKIKIGSVQISCNEFKVIDAVWRYNGAGQGYMD
jgi:hypothetical protein